MRYYNPGDNTLATDVYVIAILILFSYGVYKDVRLSHSCLYLLIKYTSLLVIAFLPFVFLARLVYG